MGRGGPIRPLPARIKVGGAHEMRPSGAAETGESYLIRAADRTQDGHPVRAPARTRFGLRLGLRLSPGSQPVRPSGSHPVLAVVGEAWWVGQRVLIAEDDRAIRVSLTRALSLEGYVVSAVEDGAQALVAAADADLIVLDVMMPNVDGLTVCRALRSQKVQTPILMVTALTETTDRVAGLDAGADDYLVKPFQLTELLARIRALLRRSAFQGNDESPEGAGEVAAVGEMRIADLRVEPATRRVWRGTREIMLSRTEFDLLELLVRNQDVVLSHSTIYDRIWGYDFGPESKNLAVYISYLRRKIDADEAVKLIHTIRAVGYTVRVL